VVGADSVSNKHALFVNFSRSRCGSRDGLSLGEHPNVRRRPPTQGG
jgi:hypothetical protein